MDQLQKRADSLEELALIYSGESYAFGVVRITNPALEESLGPEKIEKRRFRLSVLALSLPRLFALQGQQLLGGMLNLFDEFEFLLNHDKLSQSSHPVWCQDMPLSADVHQMVSGTADPLESRFRPKIPFVYLSTALVGLHLNFFFQTTLSNLMFCVGKPATISCRSLDGDIRGVCAACDADQSAQSVAGPHIGGPLEAATARSPLVPTRGVTARVGPGGTAKIARIQRLFCTALVGRVGRIATARSQVEDTFAIKIGDRSVCGGADAIQGEIQ